MLLPISQDLLYCDLLHYTVAFCIEQHHHALVVTALHYTDAYIKSNDVLPPSCRACNLDCAPHCLIATVAAEPVLPLLQPLFLHTSPFRVPPSSGVCLTAAS